MRPDKVQGARSQTKRMDGAESRLVVVWHARARTTRESSACMAVSVCCMSPSTKRESEHTWQEELNGQVSVDLSRAYKHQA